MREHSMVSAKTVEKLRELQPWQFHEFGRHGLTYHICRFCRRGVGEVTGLWKYAVRHHACDDCRNRIIGNTAV